MSNVPAKIASRGGRLHDEVVIDDVLWATVALIFLTTIISVFVRLRQRDECLGLLDDHHVTLVLAGGRTVWGDMRVHGQGLELLYGLPVETGHGVRKTSYLVHRGELDGMWALCRAVGQLSGAERAVRQAQLDARVNPPPLRRAWRSWRNALNTMRDAFTQALSVVVGQVTKATGSKALASQHKQVDATGHALVDAASNAYEPMLEAHIGRAVVVELMLGDRRIEVAGHLAEYTDRFLALFSVEHAVLSTLELRYDGETCHAPDGVEVTVDDTHLTLCNTADQPLVVDSLVHASGELLRIGATLPLGSTMRVPRPGAEATIRAQRVARVDLVAPRSLAVVRHAASET